jgi:hypothetical protein
VILIGDAQAISQPQLKVICEAILTGEGFLKAPVLASKIEALYRFAFQVRSNRRSQSIIDEFKLLECALYRRFRDILIWTLI